MSAWAKCGSLRMLASVTSVPIKGTKCNRTCSYFFHRNNSSAAIDSFTIKSQKNPKLSRSKNSTYRLIYHSILKVMLGAWHHSRHLRFEFQYYRLLWFKWYFQCHSQYSYDMEMKICVSDLLITVEKTPHDPVFQKTIANLITALKSSWITYLQVLVCSENIKVIK